MCGCLSAVPAKPDFVVTRLVGAAQASYYEQAAAAALGLPMASSVNVGQGYEHKRFVEKFRAKYPDEPYINQEAANSYIAFNLYKAARRARRLLRP